MKKAILAGAAIIFIVFVIFNAPAIVKLKADVTVKNDGILGFNADDDALHFGSVSKGNTGERKFVLKNADDFAKTVKIGATGGISNWLRFSENKLVLGPYENRTILAQIQVPSDAVASTYTAEVIIIFKRKWL